MEHSGAEHDGKDDSHPWAVSGFVFLGHAAIDTQLANFPPLDKNATLATPDLEK